MLRSHCRLSFEQKIVGKAKDLANYRKLITNRDKIVNYTNTYGIIQRKQKIPMRISTRTKLKCKYYPKINAHF